ncbi:hypothetical protein CLOP_g349, partial [Closterium sp. NIES-67]
MWAHGRAVASSSADAASASASTSAAAAAAAAAAAGRATSPVASLWDELLWEEDEEGEERILSDEGRGGAGRGHVTGADGMVVSGGGINGGLGCGEEEPWDDGVCAIPNAYTIPVSDHRHCAAALPPPPPHPSASAFPISPAPSPPPPPPAPPAPAVPAAGDATCEHACEGIDHSTAHHGYDTRSFCPLPSAFPSSLPSSLARHSNSSPQSPHSLPPVPSSPHFVLAPCSPACTCILCSLLPPFAAATAADATDTPTPAKPVAPAAAAPAPAPAAAAAPSPELPLPASAARPIPPAPSSPPLSPSPAAAALPHAVSPLSSVSSPFKRQRTELAAWGGVAPSSKRTAHTVVAAMEGNDLASGSKGQGAEIEAWCSAFQIDEKIGGDGGMQNGWQQAREGGVQSGIDGDCGGLGGKALGLMAGSAGTESRGFGSGGGGGGGGGGSGVGGGGGGGGVGGGGGNGKGYASGSEGRSLGGSRSGHEGGGQGGRPPNLASRLAALVTKATTTTTATATATTTTTTTTTPTPAAAAAAAARSNQQLSLFHVPRAVPPQGDLVELTLLDDLTRPLPRLCSTFDSLPPPNSAPGVSAHGMHTHMGTGVRAGIGTGMGMGMGMGAGRSRYGGSRLPGLWRELQETGVHINIPCASHTPRGSMGGRVSPMGSHPQATALEESAAFADIEQRSLGIAGRAWEGGRAGECEGIEGRVGVVGAGGGIGIGGEAVAEAGGGRGGGGDGEGLGVSSEFLCADLLGRSGASIEARLRARLMALAEAIATHDE